MKKQVSKHFNGATYWMYGGCFYLENTNLALKSSLQDHCVFKDNRVIH